MVLPFFVKEQEYLLMEGSFPQLVLPIDSNISDTEVNSFWRGQPVGGGNPFYLFQSKPLIWEGSFRESQKFQKTVKKIKNLTAVESGVRYREPIPLRRHTGEWADFPLVSIFENW